MPTYEVFYKSIYDGRATEAVFLDKDYSWAGDLEAKSLKEVTILIATQSQDETGLDGHRPLRTGDVVKDPNGLYWIHTQHGIWARVLGIENPTGLARSS